jgi:hypothetical protein
MHQVLTSSGYHFRPMLQKLEINVPNGLSKTVLHQLYLENVKPKVVEEVSSGNNNIDMEMSSDQDVSLVRDSTQITTPSAKQ